MSSISYTGKILNTYSIIGRAIPAIEYMHECCHAFCGTCPFAKSNNGLDKPCRCLDLIDIYSIYEKSKEDKKMNKKGEIQQEIERTQKQLAALQEKLKEAEDEVPDELDFSEHHLGWYAGVSGEVKNDTFNPKISETDQLMIKNHRAFKSEKYAKIFAEKTQLIADMLHFKYLYDRDYEPDWNEPDFKWTVWICYDNAPNKFVACSSTISYDPEKIYFSSKKLADKCADWLNKKYRKE